MKNFKLIGGGICALFAIVAFTGIFYGSSFWLSGTIIWGLGAFFLFRSANKEGWQAEKITKNNNSSINETLTSIGIINKQKEIFKKRNLNKESAKVSNSQSLVSALDNLYGKGLLDKNEYEKRKKELDEQIISEQISSSDEYKQLVELRNSGMLDDDNFTNKITRLKDFYEFFGHTNFSNFNWKLYQIIHKGEKLNSIEISTDDLKGLWVFDGGYFILYNNFSFRINWSDGNVKFGEWSFDSKFKFLNIKLNFFLEKKLIKLEIFEFNSKYMRYSTNYLKYKTRSKDYYAFKESNFNIESLKIHL